MTGRELIIYILKNNLEDVEVINSEGVFTEYISEDEVAAKFGVGVGTIRLWYVLGKIKGIRICDSIFFLKDIEDPRRDI